MALKPPSVSVPVSSERESNHALKTDLLHFNESIVQLQNTLAAPGGNMPDWPSLVAMYSSLVSQSQSIATQLGKPPEVDQSPRELERHLAQVIPHPVKPIDFARDAELVGLVLNTAAPSMVEEQARRAIPDTLPESLRLPKFEDPEAAAREAGPILQRVYAAIREHDRLAGFASRRVGLISGLDSGGSDDGYDNDDEDFAAEALPEYDWKMRDPSTVAMSEVASGHASLLREWASVLKDGR